MRNVLIVMPLGEFGGGAEQMLATYFRARRVQGKVRLHFLFLSPGSLADEAKDSGYSVEVIDTGRLRDFSKWVKAQVQIGELLDEWGIDRVLAWMPKAGVYLALPARTRRIPLYMWRHDIPTRLPWMDKWVIKVGKVRSVACSSRIAYQAFEQNELHVPSRFIYPAALKPPTNFERVTEIRRSLLKGSDGPIIGTIARLQPWKRIDLFLKAGQRLKKTLPSLRIVIVGGESHGLSSGYGTELQQLGKTLLGDSVYFAGEQRDVGNWLEAMDLFVLPSQGEPFGIVLVEAAAAGKPVVACAGGGPEEIISNGTIGAVLPRDPTPEQMSLAILHLLDQNILNQARMTNTLAAQRFSPEVMATKIDRWLDEVL